VKGGDRFFFAYDTNGNIIQDKNGIYTYDAEDAQTSYTNNS
jgi:hypothetical protein